jgi:hypothetical protein
MRERLIGFIADGIIDGVGIGATEQEVRQALGDADDAAAIRAQIWVYGDLELSFHQGRVWLLKLNARDSGATRPEVERLLAEHSIPHAIDPKLTFEAQTAITAGAGATVIFDSDGTLDSISIT